MLQGPRLHHLSMETTAPGNHLLFFSSSFLNLVVDMFFFFNYMVVLVFFLHFVYVNFHFAFASFFHAFVVVVVLVT